MCGGKVCEGGATYVQGQHDSDELCSQRDRWVSGQQYSEPGFGALFAFSVDGQVGGLGQGGGAKESNEGWQRCRENEMNRDGHNIKQADQMNS